MATLTDNPYDEKTKERKQQFVDPKENEQVQDTQASVIPEQMGTPGAVPSTTGTENPQGVVTPQVGTTAVQPVDNSVNNNQQGAVLPQAQGATATPPVAPVGMVGSEQDAQWQPQDLNTIYPAPDVVPQKVGRPQEEVSTQGGNVEGGDNDVNNNNNVDANTANNVNNETNAGDTGQKPNEISTNTTTEVDDPTDYYADGYQYQWKHDPKRESNFQRQMQSDGLAGNVRHGNRRMVTAEELAKAGWDIGDTPKDYTDTLWAIDLGVGNPKMNKKRQYVKDKNGKYVFADKLYMTPIRNDGKVMSRDELENYELSLYDKANGDVAKMIELDKVKNGGHGLILGRNMSDEQKGKLMRAHMTYYMSPGYDTLYKNAQRNIANVPYDALAEYKKRVDEQLKGKPQDSWDVYTQAYYNAVVDAMREADAAPEEGENGKNTTSTPTATTATTTTTTASAPTVEKGTTPTTTATATTATPPSGKANPSAAGTTDLTTHPTYKKSYAEFNKLSDEELRKVLAKNEKGESENQQIAAALARDILNSRGVPLVTEDGQGETEGKDTGSNAGTAYMPSAADPVRLRSPWGDGNAISRLRLDPNAAEPVRDDTPTFTKEDVKKVLDKDKKALKELKKDKNADPKEVEDLEKKVKEDEELFESLGGPEPPAERKLQDSDVYKRAQAERDKAKAELDAFTAALKDGTAQAAVLKTIDDKIKALDEEDEKATKRQRRSRIIANIGDLLQGIINSVGTLYGAKSAELTSLSERSDSKAKEENKERRKRRKELETSRKDMAAQFKKDSDKEFATLVANLKAANDRLWALEKEDYTLKEGHRNRTEEEDQKQANREKLEEIKAENLSDREETKQENAKELAEFKNNLLILLNDKRLENNKELKQFAANLSAWLKGVPTYSQANPKESSSGGGGGGRHSSSRRRSSSGSKKAAHKKSSSGSKSKPRKKRGGHPLIKLV